MLALQMLEKEAQRSGNVNNLEAKKDTQVDHPQEPCQRLDFSPERHFSNRGLHNCKLVSLCCFTFVGLFV